MATLAALRTALAKRVGYWYGASDSTGNAGTLTGTQTTTALFDSTRQEPDDQFDGAWLAYKPGTANIQWKQLAADRGYIQANGSFNLITSLSPTALAGDTYELYTGGISPNVWTDAINWSLQNSFPNRHSRVVFEVAEDPGTRIYDYHDLAVTNSIVDPTTPPVLTASGSGGGLPAGNYTIGYTLRNARGTTKISTTANRTITAGQTINVAEITNIDSNTISIDWFMSVEPGSVVLAKLSLPQIGLQSGAPAGSIVGKPIADQSALASPPISIGNLPYSSAAMVPSVNTTAQEIISYFNLARVINAGQGPEMLSEFGADGWERLGGSTIQLMFRPIQGYYLRFMGIGYVPILTNETDTTTEPIEMVLAGAEHYIWWVLTKTSTIQATNWAVLAKDAKDRFEKYKALYSQLKPIKYASTPAISAGFYGN